MHQSSATVLRLTRLTFIYKQATRSRVTASHGAGVIVNEWMSNFVQNTNWNEYYRKQWVLFATTEERWCCDCDSIKAEWRLIDTAVVLLLLALGVGVVAVNTTWSHPSPAAENTHITSSIRHVFPAHRLCHSQTLLLFQCISVLIQRHVTPFCSVRASATRPDRLTMIFSQCLIFPPSGIATEG